MPTRSGVPQPGKPRGSSEKWCLVCLPPDLHGLPQPGASYRTLLTPKWVNSTNLLSPLEVKQILVHLVVLGKCFCTKDAMGCNTSELCKNLGTHTGKAKLLQLGHRGVPCILECTAVCSQVRQYAAAYFSIGALSRQLYTSKPKSGDWYEHAIPTGNPKVFCNRPKVSVCITHIGFFDKSHVHGSGYPPFWPVCS